MNKLNAIIIEDEVPAARLLHSMITRLRPQWTLTIIPGSVDEAVAWFKDRSEEHTSASHRSLSRMPSSA